MGSDREQKDDAKDNATDDLVEGIGLLWRAARKTATGLRKDLDRTNVGRAIDDAGRELARAASNVVGRLGAEMKGTANADRRPTWTKEQPHEHEHAGPPGHEHGHERPEGETPPQGQQPPAGPTPEDPGFRIAVDDIPPDDDKPR